MLPRFPVTPNLNALKDYYVRRGLYWFIYNKAWFSEQSQQTSGELYKVMHSLAGIFAKLQYDKLNAHYSRYLSTAVGSALSVLGQAHGSPRRVGETNDDAYAQRIQFELLADRVTRNAFERVAQEYANFASIGTLVVNEATEPGRLGLFSSDSDINRSYWFGRDYYRGGVLLMRLSQPLNDFEGYIIRSKAAGVAHKVRFEIPNGSPAVDGSDELAAAVLLFAVSSMPADSETALAGSGLMLMAPGAYADFRPVVTLGMPYIMESVDGNNTLIESVNTAGNLVHSVSHNPIVLGTLEPTDLQPPVDICIFPVDLGDGHALGDDYTCIE